MDVFRAVKCVFGRSVDLSSSVLFGFEMKKSIMLWNLQRMIHLLTWRCEIKQNGSSLSARLSQEAFRHDSSGAPLSSELLTLIDHNSAQEMLMKAAQGDKDELTAEQHQRESVKCVVTNTDGTQVGGARPRVLFVVTRMHAPETLQIFW